MDLMAGKARSTHSAWDHAVAMDEGTGDITARDHSPGITLTSPPPLVSVLLLSGQFAPPGLSIGIVSWSPHAPDWNKKGVGSGVTHWRFLFFFVFLVFSFFFFILLLLLDMVNLLLLLCYLFLKFSLWWLKTKRSENEYRCIGIVHTKHRSGSKKLFEN